LDESGAPEEKEKMVVLGSGWAAISMVSALNLFRYDVTLVSPRNYFLFTPLLADAAVGSVTAESIVEPVRNFVHGGGFDFVEASATSIDPTNKVVQCETVAGKKPISIKYDKLVVAVGSVLNDQGLKGVRENTLPLRDLHDAVRIRNTVVDCLERANSSLADEDEKRRLLHFVVVGGSAIASEAAAELHDYVAQNIASAYPKLEPYFKVTVIDSKDHIHNYYDKSISAEMRRYFRRPALELVTNAKVTQLSPNEISYTMKEAQGESPSSTVTTSHKLPFGLCVWSTGNAIHPLVEDLRKKIEGQHCERALVCDAALRVQGTEDIFALGDCATVDQGMLLKKWADVFEQSDTNNDGTIDLDEYRALMKDLARTYPALKAMDDSVFALVDVNHDNILTQDEFKQLLTYMEKKLTRFPATAAVAAQQGSFLADQLNKGRYDNDDEEEKEEKKEDGDKKLGAVDEDDMKSSDKEDGDKDKKDDDDDDDEEGPVFRYKHIGGYEYVGAEDGFVERGSKGAAIVTGPGAMWMWRAVYFSRVVSASMRINMMWDWVNSVLFGSHPTRV
jgi:NADH:ubiquinone reductase (non-electrogenic)